MRKTNIICTLGPSTDDPQILREMIHAGMDVARFNFSHGSHEEHKARLAQLKKLRKELYRPVAALLDTKGPEIRLKEFAGGAAVSGTDCSDAAGFTRRLRVFYRGRNICGKQRRTSS